MVYGDSERVRNSSPLPHSASSGERKTSVFARQMVLGTYLGQFKRPSLAIPQNLVFKLVGGSGLIVNGGMNSAWAYVPFATHH